jgi:hypothetical protein
LTQQVGDLKTEVKSLKERQKTTTDILKRIRRLEDKVFA